MRKHTGYIAGMAVTDIRVTLPDTAEGGQELNVNVTSNRVVGWLPIFRNVEDALDMAGPGDLVAITFREQQDGS